MKILRQLCMALTLKECNQYISPRESFIILMLVHHILTMATIQYESVISVDLCDRMVELMEDIQRLPVYESR